MERKTRLELATFSLAKKHGMAEAPQNARPVAQSEAAPVGGVTSP